LVSNLTGTKSFTASSLTPGYTYSFIVTALNSFDESTDSAVFEALCAWVPFKPAKPTTTDVVGNRVLIDWAAPFDNGSPIYKYSILIKQSNGVFSQVISEFDGAAETSFTNTACSVPLSILTGTNFTLIQGQHVIVKVIAHNFYGPSAESQESDGGDNSRIVLVPDAPFGLVNQPLVTNAF